MLKPHISPTPTTTPRQVRFHLNDSDCELAVYMQLGPEAAAEHLTIPMMLAAFSSPPRSSVSDHPAPHCEAPAADALSATSAVAPAHQDIKAPPWPLKEAPPGEEKGVSALFLVEEHVKQTRDSTDA
ncbi:unnamed protein product [Pleuronectes platessa]|uniref:Uncharacterized protein n=1 Tax=Pleuronectes platessa TaxID=8262 RepID=A0A9N7VK00_PLEPL|nr:unnamed protein product [Pleuronectes platessa]